jgi:tetratricopeptide (TPR) repeat protein
MTDTRESHSESVRDDARVGLATAGPASAAADRERRSASGYVLLGLLLLVVTLAAYFPSLGGGYIWTDGFNIADNPNLTSLYGLWRIWASGDSEQYFPLTFTSFWVEHQLWGNRPAASRLVNILLHVACALLFARVLQQLRVPGAFLAAVVFALHPVHVESVAWISERRNLLSGVFFLLAVRAYLRWDEQAKPHGYGWSLAAFVLALLGKASVVMLPVVLILCRFYRRRVWTVRDAVCLLPFFALSGAMAAVTALYEHMHNAAANAELARPLVERAAIAGASVWFYVGKLVVPLNLSLVYETGDVDPRAWPTYVPLVALAGVAVVLWWQRGGWGRAPFAALMYFVALLLPVLGFVPFYYLRYSSVADHFQYLASMGIIALVIGTAAHALTAWRSRRAPGWPGTALAAILLVLLAVQTWRHSAVFHDEYSVWHDAVHKAPGSWIAHAMYATALTQCGKVHAALEHYALVLEQRPNEAMVHNNVGMIYQRLGRTEAALAAFQRALRADPGFIRATLNLGTLYVRLGRHEDAIRLYEGALADQGDQPLLHANLAHVLHLVGRRDEAEAHWQRAMQLAPRLEELRRAPDTRVRRP